MCMIDEDNGEATAGSFLFKAMVAFIGGTIATMALFIFTSALFSPYGFTFGFITSSVTPAYWGISGIVGLCVLCGVFSGCDNQGSHVGVVISGAPMYGNAYPYPAMGVPVPLVSRPYHAHPSFSNGGLSIFAPAPSAPLFSSRSHGYVGGGGFNLGGGRLGGVHGGHGHG